MRVFCHLVMTAFICAMTGCSLSKSDRIVSVRNAQGRPVANKTLRFAHSREPLVPGADVPLFGPATEIVEAPLDANGQARIYLSRVSWWVSFDADQTREGHAVTSITPSDIQKGGTFRFYKPRPTAGGTNISQSGWVLQTNGGTLSSDESPPTIGDANVFLSDYVLIIEKP